MPHYNDFFLDDDQEWEPVVWKKEENAETKSQEETKSQRETKSQEEEIPFYRNLISARQKAQFTPNKLAQALGIRLKELEMYERGEKIPENRILVKINKFLSARLKIN